MKKVFGIMVTVVMLIAAMTAASAEIMKGYVYRAMYDMEDFRIFELLDDGETYIEDGVAYEWSASSYLSEEFANMSFEEMENFMVDVYREHGIHDASVSLEKAGHDVIWLKLEGTTDFRTIEGMGLEDYEEPIYAASLIAWRDYDHMH